MAKIDRRMVEHIAELARLELTEDEVALFAEQLSEVLDYAERLQAIDTSDIPPTASVLPLSNVFRPDVALPSLPRDQALANAADTADGQFRVEAILEDEE